MDLKDKKTKIKFYSGMRTIGGTFIEVRYEDSRIIFDFGSIFDTNFKSNDLEFNQIIENELAPRLDGFYDDRLYPKNENFEDSAVFISHAHLDHTKMLNYVDETIPVFTSKDTKSLLEALNVNGDFLYPNKNLNSNTRNITPCDYDEIVKVGKISVKFIRIDHDAYGACALLINTPDLRISYTGDIRLHGKLLQESENFIEQSKDVDMLIIEGVSVSFIDSFEDSIEMKFEKEAIAEFNNIVNSTDKPVYFNFYLANIERILNIIKTSGREVVLDAYSSYIVFKTTGLRTLFYTIDDNYGLDLVYLRDFDEIVNDSRYLIQIRKDNIDMLSKAVEGSSYIHFDSEPLGEFDSEYLPFINKIENFKIIFNLLHCSGHAYPGHLMQIINQIKPKILVPIHSFKPEMLYNDYGARMLPEKNEII